MNKVVANVSKRDHYIQELAQQYLNISEIDKKDLHKTAIMQVLNKINADTVINNLSIENKNLKYLLPTISNIGDLQRHELFIKTVNKLIDSETDSTERIDVIQSLAKIKNNLPTIVELSQQFFGQIITEDKNVRDMNLQEKLDIINFISTIPKNELKDFVELAPLLLITPPNKFLFFEAQLGVIRCFAEIPLAQRRDIGNQAHSFFKWLQEKLNISLNGLNRMHIINKLKSIEDTKQCKQIVQLTTQFIEPIINNFKAKNEAGFECVHIINSFAEIKNETERAQVAVLAQKILNEKNWQLFDIVNYNNRSISFKEISAIIQVFAKQPVEKVIKELQIENAELLSLLRSLK